jgi:arylsulfatase
VSLAYTISNANAASQHHIQYYEISGSRAIYKDGWKAEVYHRTGTVFTNDKWELYNLNTDFNEQKDLAATQPEKLKELQALFEEEAQQYNIYPLLGDTTQRTFFKLTKGPFDTRKQAILYPGTATLFSRSGPVLYQHSFSITADVDITSDHVEGVLLATGGRFTGFTFFIQEGKLKIAHNNNGKLVYLESSQAVPKGKVLLKYQLNYTPAQNLTDNAGTEALYINDVKVAERPITKADATIMPYDEGLDTGRDNGSPVAPVYQSPFVFTGILNKIIIDHLSIP